MMVGAMSDDGFVVVFAASSEKENKLAFFSLCSFDNVFIEIDLRSRLSNSFVKLHE